MSSETHVRRFYDRDVPEVQVLRRPRKLPTYSSPPSLMGSGRTNEDDIVSTRPKRLEGLRPPADLSADRLPTCADEGMDS